MAQTATIGYLLTLDEAAEIASLSRRTLKRRIASGHLPVVQPGGPNHTLRIDSGDLARFLEASRSRRPETRA